MPEFPHIKARDLAKYLLAIQGAMSHLKLQKLLYYVEAWHLALYDQALIPDDFKAWVHGPVCPDVWHMVKDLSILNGEIFIKEDKKDVVLSRGKKALSRDQIALIKDVLEEYGDKSAHHLEALTHSELPWIEARGNLPASQASSNRIKKSTMKKFYRERLQHGKKVA